MRGRRCAGCIALILAPAVVLAASGPAFAEETQVPTKGLQLELGLFGGGHFFANDLELGVADDPGHVPHPKDGFIFGARAAGMTTIQAAWFQEEEERRGDVEPDFIAVTPLDVLNIVRSLAR